VSSIIQDNRQARLQQEGQYVYWGQGVGRNCDAHDQKEGGKLGRRAVLKKKGTEQLFWGGASQPHAESKRLRLGKVAQKKRIVIETPSQRVGQGVKPRVIATTWYRKKSKKVKQEKGRT